jgi:DegV family protein with EDD domain
VPFVSAQGDRRKTIVGSVPVAIRIVTDTTACLPREFIAAHPVEVVPQVIRFGQESFLEDVEISYPEFVRRLKSSAELPSTAAPLVGDFLKAYQRQLASASTLLSIHPSEEVSGTVRSALTARAHSFPDSDIRILDTRTVGANLASMVMDAVGWAEGEVAADEIMRRLQAMIPRGRIYFLVATLKYLQKGGRIGGASALIGSALQIKPILQLEDGKVGVLEKVRTHHKALERLMELVAAECPRSPEAHLSVMHADALEMAQGFAARLMSSLGFEGVPIYSVGSAITTHAGPGTLAVGFFV